MGGTRAFLGRAAVLTIRRFSFSTLGLALHVGASAGPTLIILGETFDFEVFGYGEEGVELLLGDVDFAVVHEVQDVAEIFVADPSEVDEGVGVGEGRAHRLAQECVSEEGRAGRKDDLVGLEGVVGIIVDGEADVEEVLLVAELLEGARNVGLEVVPPKAELVVGGHDDRLELRWGQGAKIDVEVLPGSRGSGDRSRG